MNQSDDMSLREIDAKIHQLIYNEKAYNYLGNNDLSLNNARKLPHYSTDMSDVWKVVELLPSMGYSLTFHFRTTRYTEVTIHQLSGGIPSQSHSYKGVEHPATTICKALLNILTVDQGKTT
mgnify:CR=1 FL=1